MNENLFAPKKPSAMTVLLSLLSFCFLGALVGSVLGVGLGMANGMDAEAILGSLSADSQPDERGFVRLFLALNHLFMFFLPGLAVAGLFYKKDWQKWLGLERLPSVGLAFFSMLFLAVLMPLVQYSYFLNKLVELPDWARMAEDSTAEALKALLVMDSPAELAINFFVIAVLPGLGEEIVFRGIVQKTFENQFKNGHVAVWLAAFLFSAIHFQFEGFLPRMLMGAGLGYLFLWTKNLWAPILAHIFNNGAQVIAQYFFLKGQSTIDLEKEIEVPVCVAILSLAAAIFLGRMIQLKWGKKPAPPSPPIDDF